jgi:hypothetical protein
VKGHEYDAGDETAENYGRWVTVRPRCACGWQGDRYQLPPKAKALHDGHVWAEQIAELDRREAEVVAGRLCAFCEDKPPVHTLCRLDDHCDRNGCVRSCNACMDELRDERD